ncbi:MAG: trypsin-like peptidase domain-containing protein [Calditrichaeota bacterium]|nr:trypsin-like peptidase domain-containing protein [Calditrichota bacterium]
MAQTQAPLLSELERDLAALVDEAKPSVVSVAAKVITCYEERREGGLFGLWGQKRSRRTVTLHNVGSGLVVDDSGHVVTRTSVVADAEEIVVRLYDGRMVPASFVGADHAAGLAVIRIPTVPRVARLGSTQNLRSGSWVTVIGSSLGMSPSVSFGLVDGLRDDGLMQLSASVAAGSAGSPVFNTRGEVVGLVAAAVGPRGHARSLLAAGDAPSYVLAYPIEQVRSVVQRIIELESVGDGWLGITVMSRDSSDRPTVTAIVEGGPAHQAGVREGDILLRFAGKELAGSDDAARAVRATAPGSTVTLEVEREGQPLSLRVTVGQRPAAPKVAVRGSFMPGWPMPEQHLAPTTIGPADQRTLEETVRRLQRRLGELEKEIRSLRRSSPKE